MSANTSFCIAKEKDLMQSIWFCRSVGTYEKRFLNFFIRAAFHDSGAIDPAICKKYPNSVNCGGADSSALLSVAEMMRPENNYDSFSFFASRAVIKIASFYDVSASDVLAVSFALLDGTYFLVLME